MLPARLKERLHHSAFFLGAVLLHLVLFLMVLGYVVWPTPPPEQKVAEFNPAALPQPTPPPVLSPSDSSSHESDLIHPIVPTSNSEGNPLPPAPHLFSQQLGHDLDPGNHVDSGTPMPIAPHPNDPSRTKTFVDPAKVKEAQELWHPHGSPKFVVPIYLAKYADGDWDCNNYQHEGRLDSGALPNLMAKVQEWSEGSIKGRDLKVVALDSPQLISDPPPFLFFTGHKDFHLTAAEIDNLRAYLQLGGCIWGDSAFAGSGSRFDVAFHREMKRVLPDRNLPFEPLSADHDIFTKSRFVLDTVPAGMNHRADPVECINLDGKVAILYTPNDYSDMMTMLLQPGRDEREAQADEAGYWTREHPLFTPAGFTWNAGTYYRNYEPGSAMAAYKLSMNILVYLLHRFDDELELTP